jgi:tungstate transport system substrate-binding protein
VRKVLSSSCALIAFMVLAALYLPSVAENFIVLQSTTSTQNAGLFEFILPLFKKKTGIEVRVVAVGTGQALRNAKNGDGDVVLVHSPQDEEAFVKEGWGVKRYPVMHNDFVIVGPAADEAGIAGLDDASEALRKIARATLNLAVGKNAYALTDRATWLSFANKRDHRILVQGDRALINQYGVILVNPRKHATVKAAEGQAFIDWLTGDEGQAAIAGYTIKGQQLFFPNAARDCVALR